THWTLEIGWGRAEPGSSSDRPVRGACCSAVVEIGDPSMSMRLALSLSLVGLVLLAVGCSPNTPIASQVPEVEGSQPTLAPVQNGGVGGSAVNERSSAHEHAAPAPGAKVPEPQRPRTVKVAAVQCSSTLGDVDGNRTKLTALVTEAAAEGARIVV